jgi:hypothetical protein
MCYVPSILLLLFGVLWEFKTLFAYSSILNCSLIETDFTSLHNFVIFIWQEIMDFYVLAAYLVSDRFASTERSHN